MTRTTLIPDDVSDWNGMLDRMERLERTIAFYVALAGGGGIQPNGPLKIYGPFLPMFSINSIASGAFVDVTFNHNLNIPNGHYVPLGTFAGGGASDRAQPPTQMSRSANSLTCRFANSWSGAIGPFTWDGILIGR